jgi:hypothetical protein
MRLETLIKSVAGVLIGAGFFATVHTANSFFNSDATRNLIPWVSVVLSGLPALMGILILTFRRNIRQLGLRWSRLSTAAKQPMDSQIAEEIRRRILAEAQNRSDASCLEEQIKATLDAMEEIVDMPRSEMERIAHQVCREYDPDGSLSTDEPPIEKTPLDKPALPWTAMFFTAITAYLIRRGTPWFLLTGALALVAISYRMIRWVLHREDDEYRPR